MVLHLSTVTGAQTVGSFTAAAAAALLPSHPRLVWRPPRCQTLSGRPIPPP